MKDLKRYTTVLKIIIFLLVINIIVGGNFVFTVLAYIFTCLLMIIRTLMVPSESKIKKYLILLYIVIMSLQITFISLATFQPDHSELQRFLDRLFGAAVIWFPFLIERFVTINKYSSFYLPSAQEVSSISFADIKSGRDKIINTMETVTKAGKAFSVENLKEIKNDLHRHNSFQYINKGVLTKEYFEEAEKWLEDRHIYIILSNTGSPASEIISTFTRKQYNHASLSFDPELKTIISYNGGERVYPPGLNYEMLDFFNKKADASILVYKLPCTQEQKTIILDKVKEINRDGSAYNLMGLVLRYSHKPNIMFCSQFVYKMLNFAGIAYFEKRDGEVKPTDLIEMDYYRRLQFVYEMKLNEN
ncbi:hypothetical protein Ana3638_07910 [Anaerocolumna sedimenticola]|uniref:Uncharacterized protein n=1 Tax=Anaerocolumna sedimenticola TaxID=2696063 RepID=A0A6P1TK89_9FIRM|nr:hypothetical protein [Anaerocolumna sedimenticola]QHQ60707.1 hypothetical protein Ana3638_07910 [Anaerocolumna sedimenticola]